MTPLKFEDLTRKQIDFLTVNDCGGNHFDVPDFSFDSACWQHDVNYWVGVTTADRKAADIQFYNDMQEIVDDMPWYRRIYMRFIALIYYYGVRVGGGIGFNKKRKRYYEDLVYAMSIADHCTSLPKNWDDEIR